MKDPISRLATSKLGVPVALMLALLVICGLWWLWGFLTDWWDVMFVLYPLALLILYLAYRIAQMPSGERSELLGDLARKFFILAGLALSTAAAVFFAKRGEMLGVFVVQGVTAYAGWSGYEERERRRNTERRLAERREKECDETQD